MREHKSGRDSRDPVLIALILLASLSLALSVGLLSLILRGQVEGGARVGLWLLAAAGLGVGLWTFVTALRERS